MLPPAQSDDPAMPTQPSWGGSHSRQRTATYRFPFPEPSRPIGIVDCEEIVENSRYIAALREERFCGNLIWLSADLLASTLSRQGLLHSALRARLQVEGVTLHFLDDVFRLNLALEPPQGILDRLAFLQSNFGQIHHPHENYIGHTELTPLWHAEVELSAR